MAYFDESLSNECNGRETSISSLLTRSHVIDIIETHKTKTYETKQLTVNELRTALEQKCGKI